jgi:hypothetical protein
MPRLDAYSRIIQKGLSDPLSGATIPTSNDHTDQTWRITDLYEREILINTSTGFMDYRTQNDLWSPVISSGGTRIKEAVIDIGAWAMNNVSPIILSTEITNTKKILSMRAVIYPDPADPNQVVYQHDVRFVAWPSPYNLRIGFVGGFATIGFIKTGTNLQNYFSERAVTLGYYSDLTINRGVITIKYMD